MRQWTRWSPSLMVQAVQTIIPRNVYALTRRWFRHHDPPAAPRTSSPRTAPSPPPSAASPDVRALKKRFHEIVEGTAALGVRAEIDYDWGYPRRSTMRTRPSLPPKWRASNRAPRRWMRGEPRDGVRGFLLHWRRGPPTSLGTGRGRGCTTRPSTSTTRRLRWAPAFARLVERASRWPEATSRLCVFLRDLIGEGACLATAHVRNQPGFARHQALISRGLGPTGLQRTLRTAGRGSASPVPRPGHSKDWPASLRKKQK